MVGSPLGFLGVVETNSRMSGRGREALQDVRVWLGDSRECPGVVERPSRISGSPSRMSGSGRDSL